MNQNNFIPDNAVVIYKVHSHLHDRGYNIIIEKYLAKKNPATYVLLYNYGQVKHRQLMEIESFGSNHFDGGNLIGLSFQTFCVEKDKECAINKIREHTEATIKKIKSDVEAVYKNLDSGPKYLGRDNTAKPEPISHLKI